MDKIKYKIRIKFKMALISYEFGIWSLTEMNIMNKIIMKSSRIKYLNVV